MTMMPLASAGGRMLLRFWQQSHWTPRFVPSKMFFASSSASSLYDVLGVKSNADQQTIKEAFFRLSKEHHPDLNPHKENAEESFRNLAAAYEVLSNPESRKQYDHESGLRRSRTNPTGPTWSKTSPYSRRQAPPYGVDPEFGRKVEVDLSAERMARAWEAYKLRWTMEEERLRVLEEKKLKFRLELDEARESMYSKMTMEERETLREHMRLLRKPKFLDDDDVKDGGKEKKREANHTDQKNRRSTRRINIDFEEETKGSQREDEGDPLFFGLRSSNTSDRYDRDFVAQGLRNTREQIETIKEEWRKGEEKSPKYGIDMTRENRLNRLWVVLLVCVFAAAIVVDRNYQNDPDMTNEYLSQLKKEQEERQKRHVESRDNKDR